MRVRPSRKRNANREVASALGFQVADGYTVFPMLLFPVVSKAGATPPCGTWVMLISAGDLCLLWDIWFSLFNSSLLI